MSPQYSNQLNNVIHTLPNGDHYEGKQTLYEGSINGQLKHGFGIYRYSNGDLYEGNWTND